MMDHCLEMMSNMMGSGMMANSLSLLPILGALLLIWMVGLIILGGLGLWAVRRLAR